MPSPYISIIIPIYGSTEFLDECVTSVINQTYSDWEAVIAIYGHGEDGGNIKVQADEIAIKDSRFRVVIQSPILITKVQLYNDLMNEINGEWVAILDKNDTWCPEKLAKQIEAKQTVAKNAAVIGTFTQNFGEKDNIPQIKAEWVTHSEMSIANNIISNSAIFHRSYSYWRFVEGSCGIEEYELWIRILLSGGKLYNVPEVLTNTRINLKTISRTAQTPFVLHIHYKNAMKSK